MHKRLRLRKVLLSCVDLWSSDIATVKYIDNERWSNNTCRRPTLTNIYKDEQLQLKILWNKLDTVSNSFYCLDLSIQSRMSLVHGLCKIFYQIFPYTHAHVTLDLSYWVGQIWIDHPKIYTDCQQKCRVVPCKMKIFIFFKDTCNCDCESCYYYIVYLALVATCIINITNDNVK